MAKYATVITSSNTQAGMVKRKGKVTRAENQRIRAAQKKLGLKMGSTEI